MSILKEEKILREGITLENVFHASSNLLKSSYNYSTNQLVVTFKNGGVYLYNNVPNDLYEDFKSSPSSGSYLNSQIKNKYTTVKKGTLSSEQLEKINNQINEYKKGDLL